MRILKDHFLFKPVVLAGRPLRQETVRAVQRIIEQMGDNNPFDTNLEDLRKILGPKIGLLVKSFDLVNLQNEEEMSRAQIFWIAVHDSFHDVGTRRLAETLLERIDEIDAADDETVVIERKSLELPQQTQYAAHAS